MRNFLSKPRALRRGAPRGAAYAATSALAAAAMLLTPAAPALAAAPAEVDDPVAYVDPLIGTTNAGNTFPGAVAPFGMLNWGPDQSVAREGTMRTASPSGYEYTRDDIRGFGLTHVSGAGCTGLSGDIPFMPWAGDVEASPSVADGTADAYRTTFSHDDEHAAPGSYSVELDSGISVDLAATTRTGAGHFAYPEGETPTMLVRTSDSLVGSSDADVSIDPGARTISGSVTSGNFCGPFTGDGILQRSYYTVYFTAEFDTGFASTGTWVDDEVAEGSTEASGGTGYSGGGENGYPPVGKGSGGWVTFDDGSDVNVRVGISYVSLENAEANLEAENPEGAGADQVAADTARRWNDELGRITIGGGTDDERTTFYSALYHALLHPNVTSDANGEYAGFDGETHALSEGQGAQYATFSGWDVYRSQVQLVTLLDADRGADIAESLLNQANQNDGVWDRWTHNSGAVHVMVGDPSAPALAGITAFGGTDYPVQEAFDSLAQAARVPTELDASRRGWNVAVEGQRPSLDQFLEHGYYPEGCNAWGCVNETLEMAAADYGLASLAEHLGDDDAYDEFVTRSQSWQKQFNPNATKEGGYFQGRMADGTWKAGFDPARGDGFVEGTAAQYAWLVQHDPEGLFDAMGGREKAVERLDDFFKDEDGGWVLTGSWDDNVHANMDNEPSIQTPWLYNYAGVPSKTQETVRATIDRLWLTSKDGVPNGPDGIPGNDDLGAMSSWLVFAAMGVFPENPSRAELTVAAPLFESVRIDRADGATITINAPGAQLDTPYISGMSIDGVPTTKTYLPASAIAADTRVDFELQKTPDEAWGTGADDAPPSVRDGEITDTVTASPTTLQATPGGPTGEVALEAQRLSSSATGDVTFAVDAPQGLTPSVEKGKLGEADEKGAARATLALRADADLELGDYDVTVSFARGDVDLGERTLTVSVGEHTRTLLETSFEPGQPTPEESEAFEESDGIGGYCCGLTTAELKAQAEHAKTGSWAVTYSGRGMKENASASDVLLHVDPTEVSAGSTFSYQVFPQVEGGPFGDYVQNASAHVAVDLLYADGTRLSQSAEAASNGAPLTPTEQAAALEPDAWNSVAVTIPEADDGKTLDRVLLAFDVGDAYATEGENDGYLRGYVDDLLLTEPIAPLTVSAATGLTATEGEALDETLASFSGGSGASAGDYSATVSWGDGSDDEALDVVVADAEAKAAAAASYAVAGEHTFVEPGIYEATLTIADADDVRTSTAVAITVEAAEDPGDSDGDGDGDGDGSGDSDGDGSGGSDGDVSDGRGDDGSGDDLDADGSGDSADAADDADDDALAVTGAAAPYGLAALALAAGAVGVVLVTRRRAGRGGTEG